MRDQLMTHIDLFDYLYALTKTGLPVPSGIQFQGRAVAGHPYAAWPSIVSITLTTGRDFAAWVDQLDAAVTTPAPVSDADPRLKLHACAVFRGWHVSLNAYDVQPTDVPKHIGSILTTVVEGQTFAYPDDDGCLADVIA